MATHFDHQSPHSEGLGRGLGRPARPRSAVGHRFCAIVSLALLASACQVEAQINPNASATTAHIASTQAPPSTTSTALASPSAAFWTASPTSTTEPTATPTPTSTATPGPLALTVGQAARIESLAVWGKGVASGLVWAPDGRELAVPSGLGVDLIGVDPLTFRMFLPSAFAVQAVAYSPDGRYLAVAGSQVQLWDRQTLSVVATLPGVIENGVHRLVFSQGGMWLVGIGTTSGGGDPGARLIVWRVSDRQIQRTWETDYCGGGADFALSPDGRQLARLVCGNVWVERTATGDEMVTLGEGESIVAITFLADGQTLAASSYADPAGIRFIDVSGQAPNRTFDVDVPYDLAASADGKTLWLQGMWDDAQRVWVSTLFDVPAGRVRYTVADVRDAALSPDGRRLAVARLSDGAIELRDVEAPVSSASLSWAPVVTHVAFGRLGGPEGKVVLAIGERQGRVGVIDPTDGHELFATDVFSDAVTAVALDARGELLAAARRLDERRGEIVVLDLLTGGERYRIVFKAPHEWELPAEALAFSLDGSAIAARTSSFGLVRAWSLADGAELEHPEQRRWHQAQALGADPAGRLWTLEVDASNAADPTTLTLTDRGSSPGRAYPLGLPQQRICQELQRFSLDGEGRFVAMGCDQPELVVWDLADGGDAWAVSAHEAATGDGFYGNILAVSFAPYGPLLATAGYDGTVRLWDAATRSPAAVLRGHRAAVTELAWSPDGRWLASVSEDGTVRLWGMNR